MGGGRYTCTCWGGGCQCSRGLYLSTCSVLFVPVPILVLTSPGDYWVVIDAVTFTPHLVHTALWPLSKPSVAGGSTDTSTWLCSDLRHYTPVVKRNSRQLYLSLHWFLEPHGQWQWLFFMGKLFFFLFVTHYRHVRWCGVAVLLGITLLSPTCTLYLL